MRGGGRVVGGVKTRDKTFYLGPEDRETVRFGQEYIGLRHVFCCCCCFYYMECDTHCSLLMKGRLLDRSCAEVFLLMFCYFDILVPVIINII